MRRNSMKQPQTTKLAFIVKDNKIYEKEYKFDFFGGFALSQKQKTIDAFHKEISKDGILDILEISRKSKNQLGNALSAFNLMITLDNNKYPLESVYQSSKVFNNNIQFIEVLNLSPLEAKRTIKERVEKDNLILTAFKCLGMDFPLFPKTLFYDYIYVVALIQNPNISKEIVNYYCYTDVEFNHKKQFASQARACAIFKYLYDNDILKETIEDINKFIQIYYEVIIPYRLELL